jgi:hypothetical protein
MTRSFVILLSVLLSASIAPAAEIPQGAHVLLRMENSVNTRTAKEGDFVYLRTAVPIANSGEIAVPAGSYVQGVVSEAKQSGRVKGRARRTRSSKRKARVRTPGASRSWRAAERALAASPTGVGRARESALAWDRQLGSLPCC